MPYAVYDKGGLEELVGRLYELKGRGAKALAEKAGQALLEANPDLANLSKMRPGMVLAVPSVANLKFTEEVWPAASSPVETGEDARRAREALDANQLQYQADGHTLESLRSPMVRRAVRKQPAREKQLDEVTEVIKARRKKTKKAITDLKREEKRLSNPPR